jgi:hypothetical protein
MQRQHWHSRLRALCLFAAAVSFFAARAVAAELQDEWKKTIEAAKKAGKVVAGGPPTAVLRKQYKETFESRFGIELELVSAPGPQVGLAKGTLAVALGLSQRFVDPYIKGGLPIKVLLTLKEGLSGSNGFGTVAIMRNAPHSNAAKVYNNWLLGKEGQDLYGRALTQGSRRLDVDTKWLAKFNTPAAKDVTTPEDFEKVRFYGEDIITERRVPGGDFARKILK